MTILIIPAIVFIIGLLYLLLETLAGDGSNESIGYGIMAGAIISAIILVILI